MKNKIKKMILAAKNDTMWYAKNAEWIHKKYNQQYLAYSMERILGADPDFQKLLTKLKNKKVDLANTTIDYISDEEYFL